jgi:hypothetical protein
MSLHKFAEQVAAQGRGDDSLLVHMTPDEVRNLQRFAEANGTTLTINPTTGLPEAGLLSDLFKAVAPIALGAFLGPAGFGLSAGMAGLATGGITALATGSLSRGLMAGLGAYGGAGLAGGLSNIGSTALSSEALAAANASADPIASLAAAKDAATAAGTVAPTGMQAFTEGAKRVFTEPGGFGQLSNALGGTKGALTTAGMIAAPLMATQPTTKLPDLKDTGYIRQFDYNINPDTGKPDPLYGMRAMTPIKASEFGNKTLQGQRDLFRQQNPNPYELGVGSLNQAPQQQQQPTPMAGGGIVALAEGGDAILKAYQAGDFKTASDLIGKAGLNAQDVVSKYNLDAAQAADVAKNLGYTGDMSATKYGTGYVAPPVYNQFADQNITGFFQDLATKNARGAYSPDMYDVAGQIKDAIKTYNPDIDQVNRILNSGATVPIYGGAVAGGTDVNLKDFANEFAMATSKTPFVDANNRITLDATRAAQAAQNELDTLFNPNNGTLMPIKNSDFELGGKYYGRIGERDKLIADFYRDPANKAKLDAAQKTVFDKYGVPENMRLAPRAIATNLAKIDTAALPSAYVDPSKFTNYKDYAAAQNAASLKAFEDEIAAYKKLGIDLLAKEDPQQLHPSAGQIKLANLRAGLLRDGVLPGEQNRATGVTPGVNTGLGAGVNTGIGAGVIPGGFYGNKTNPGDITVNPDGTVTVQPNIPYRPDGGFSGVGEVRDAYTKGGGSLGYTAKAPKTMAEFNQLYNKQTGDSLAAYDYLMGKGGGKYPVKSGVPKLQENYNEFVLGKKAVTKPVVKTTTEIKGTPGQPQTYFDEKAYLEANPDVKAEMQAGKSNFTTAYEHWLMYGQKEGRPFTGDYTGYTTAKALADANKSVQDSGGTGDDGGGGGGGGTGAGAGTGNAMAMGGATGYAIGGGLGSLGSYSDGGRLLKGPGDGVSDSIPATIGQKQQPARLADGEFVIPARIVSELGNGSTDAGAKKLYAMMDRVQRARGKTTGKNKVAANSRADKYLPA